MIMEDEVVQVDAGNVVLSIKGLLFDVGLAEWDKFDETAEDVANFWAGFLTASDSEPTKLLEPRDQLIVVKNPFYSICSFNLFPFWGEVYVGYLGRAGVIELSCVQDNIKRLASEIITQEVLAEDIAAWLTVALDHTDIAVLVVANHFNIKSGLEIQESISSVMHGAFRNEPSVRQEFFDLCALSDE